jgi:hypothetical protein
VENQIQIKQESDNVIFQFTEILDQTVSQKTMAEKIVQPLVDDLIQECNFIQLFYFNREKWTYIYVWSHQCWKNVHNYG